jgi:FkbM family methyltransferase
MSARSFLERIDQSKALHFMVDRLGGRRAVNGILQHVPLPRRSPGGARYRVRYLDTVPLANEIFVQKIYDAAIDPSMRTFVDLGCNVGLFLARLAERVPPAELRGLAIDADPAMVDETRWTAFANRLDGVIPVHGLAASPSEGPAEEDFFVNSCRIISSRFAMDEPGQSVKDDWTKVRVARVNVEALFKERIGDVPCDLLKVDIEGSERDWFVESNPMLRRARRLVIECHKWVMPLDELLGRMRAVGFGEPRFVRDSEALAVVIADRPAA